MFDRRKDPNNIEELMIAEYHRRIEENDSLVKELNNVRKAADDMYAELMGLLRDEENRSAHLQSIIDKDEGVVDLQEPILLYKSSVAGKYYYKDWLQDHADDEGEDEGLDAYITALGSSDEDCIKWFKEHGSRSYSKLASTEKRVFKITLKVPVFGVLAYDPEYSKTQLIVPEKNYADERWVDMPLEEFYHCTATKIRDVANKALKEYKNDLAKKAAEKTES